MAAHLIIDGYNLIRRSPSLSILDRQDLESGRNELIRRLALYKRMKSLPITVVFDGSHPMSPSPVRGSQQGIHVVFSRKGQTADEVIIRMAGQIREKAIVVTSDRQVQAAVERYATTVVPSEDFEKKIEMALRAGQKGMDDHTTDPIEARGTRKKGPSKRLPRAARRAQRQIRKL
jgi:predicted RNA-binding protein with PIN domain